MDPSVVTHLTLILGNAVAVFIVARLWPGIQIRGFGTSILVALIYGVLNWLLWWPMAVLGLPAVILTFGLFLFAINGLLLMLTAKIVPDFEVSGCMSASLAALLIGFLSSLLRSVLMPHGVSIFLR